MFLPRELFLSRRQRIINKFKSLGWDVKGTVQVPPDGTGKVIATLSSGGVEYQKVIEADYATPTGVGAALGTAVTLAAKSSAGARLSVRPGDWAQGHTPVAATQATTSKAAGAAGVCHVATSVTCVVSTVGTAQTAALVFALRDGATGAGTILWTVEVSLPTATTQVITLSGLNIVGTAATAMTLETVAAPAAAAFASVSLTGYDTPAA